MNRIMPENRQRILSYALIGYLEVVRRLKSTDIYYNYTIGPRKFEKQMRRSGVDSKIIDLLIAIDEIESMYKNVDEAEFANIVTRAISPVLKTLRKDIQFSENDKSLLEM